jgi:nucleotide-binding universal stress UspA family protein
MPASKPSFASCMDLAWSDLTTPDTTPLPVPLDELHLHRLLVALDGSANAELALAAALTAAQRDHAQLTLLAVVPDVLGQSAGWMAGAGDPARLQQEADAYAQKILRDAVERLPAAIPVTTILRHGKAGHEIVAQARGGNYDAIVMGARGLGRVGALIGSVSTYVLHHAETAVFVAHAPREPRG